MDNFFPAALPFIIIATLAFTAVSFIDKNRMSNHYFLLTSAIIFTLVSSIFIYLFPNYVPAKSHLIIIGSLTLIISMIISHALVSIIRSNPSKHEYTVGYIVVLLVLNWIYYTYLN